MSLPLRVALLFAASVLSAIALILIIVPDARGILAASASNEDRRDILPDRQVMNVTCWAPGGEVVLRAEGLAAEDFVMRDDHYSIHREGRLVGLVTRPVTCAVIPQSREASAN